MFMFLMHLYVCKLFFNAPVCKSVVVLVARESLAEGKVLCCQAVLQTDTYSYDM